MRTGSDLAYATCEGVRLLGRVPISVTHGAA